MINRLKTILLMGILSVILIVIGGAIGGSTGVLVCLIFSVAMNIFQYFYSDSIAIRSSGAQPLSNGEYPELHHAVQKLTTQAGLPMPSLYIMPSPQPNAFATGRNPDHAAVVVTQGLLQTLSGAELEGVLAHEISHIKNRDILVSTVAASFASAISGIASIVRWCAIFGGFGRDDDNGGVAGIVMAIVAPIAAVIIQLAVSRSREYLADESAARLTHNPKALANALLRLERGSQTITMQQATPSMAHMYIVQPFVGGKGLANLFSTHPSTQSRVDRLYKMVV